MSYKPTLTTHVPAASLNVVGSVHSPSISMATSSQYRQLLSNYGPPPIGYTQVSEVCWTDEKEPILSLHDVLGPAKRRMSPTSQFPTLNGIKGPGNSQVPQSKYAELLAIIEELGKEIGPNYAGSKSAMERLKRGIIHARGLVRECLPKQNRIPGPSRLVGFEGFPSFYRMRSYSSSPCSHETLVFKMLTVFLSPHFPFMVH